MFDKLQDLIRKIDALRAERAAAQKPDPPHVTVAAWQVNAARFASNVAMCVLVYFLWLYTLDIARDRAAELHLTRAGAWTGDLQFWFPYIVGFAIISFGVPYVAKISIPTFMALTWREAAWPKAWALAIALAVSLVIIAGTFTIQGDAILERDRESAVAVQQVEQSQAGLQAQIAAAERRLSEMRNNPNAYMAQAASVGAAEWERSYVAQARATNDARLPMIERALGAARAADAEQARLDGLRAQLAQQSTAAVQRHVATTEATNWISGVLDWVEGIRAILLSLVMDVVCLMMPWIARHLELTRNRQLGMGDQSGWADEGHRIEDMRAEDSIVPQPMQPMREAMFDGETGDELSPVNYPRFRRKPKRKGKAERVETEPQHMPDETGVAVDGGQRQAVIAGSAAVEPFRGEDDPISTEGAVEQPQHGNYEQAQGNEQPSTHAQDRFQEAASGHATDEYPNGQQNGALTQPDLLLSADDVAALEQTLAQQAPDENSNAGDEQARDDGNDDDGHVELPDGEGVMVDPARVAAE